MNFLGFLRLAERCADILFSIRQEVSVAGGDVEEELADPVAKLEAYVPVCFTFYDPHCPIAPFIKFID